MIAQTPKTMKTINYTASNASSMDVYDSVVEDLLKLADMGSLSEVPTPPTVIPTPPQSVSVESAPYPKPSGIPSRAQIPHQYGTGQRVRFDDSCSPQVSPCGL